MEKITEATADCFNTLLQIRDYQGALPSPETVHGRLKGQIEGLRDNLRRSELSERDATDIVYAIVAFADEIALTKPEPMRGYWMRSALQISYFNENRAGEGFFARLTQIRGDSQRTTALRIYYLCLMFGFQGQYAVHGGDVELLRLVESLRGDLERRLDKVRDLSPAADPPDEPQIRKGARNPAGWIALGVFAIALGAFVGLKVSLGSKVSSLEDQVRKMANVEKPGK